MIDDFELFKRLQKLTGPELLDAIAIATGGPTIEEKQAETAAAVQQYIRKGNSIADYGEDHPLNAAAIELHRQATDKDEEAC